jgi:hypothetical protein
MHQINLPNHSIHNRAVFLENTSFGGYNSEEYNNLTELLESQFPDDLSSLASSLRRYSNHTNNNGTTFLHSPFLLENILTGEITPRTLMSNTGDKLAVAFPINSYPLSAWVHKGTGFPVSFSEYNYRRFTEDLHYNTLLQYIANDIERIGQPGIEEPVRQRLCRLHQDLGTGETWKNRLEDNYEWVTKPFSLSNCFMVIQLGFPSDCDYSFHSSELNLQTLEDGWESTDVADDDFPPLEIFLYHCREPNQIYSLPFPNIFGHGVICHGMEDDFFLSILKEENFQLFPVFQRLYNQVLTSKGNNDISERAMINHKYSFEHESWMVYNAAEKKLCDPTLQSQLSARTAITTRAISAGAYIVKENPKAWQAPSIHGAEVTPAEVTPATQVLTMVPGARRRRREEQENSVARAIREEQAAQARRRAQEEADQLAAAIDELDEEDEEEEEEDTPLTPAFEGTGTTPDTQTTLTGEEIQGIIQQNYNNIIQNHRGIIREANRNT